MINLKVSAAGPGGGGLNDGRWHSVAYSRRGMELRLGVDDAPPLTAAIYGSEAFLDYSSAHVGAVAAPGKMK